MSLFQNPPSASADSAAVRHAGPEVLSLALMDARNHTLQFARQFEDGVQGLGELLPALRERLSPAVWTLGNIGWYQERWIARNMQWRRGRHGDPHAARLASIEPQSDEHWAPGTLTPAARWDVELPDFATLRAYLLGTLETTLELLDKCQGDEELYFFRRALYHEDLQLVQLRALAQALGLNLQRPLQPALAQREPITMVPTRWELGVAEPGFAFDIERPQHEVAVPEFEIDAQPVSWSQFVEFVDDGGYDRSELWHPQGWEWLQRLAASEGRRGPRYVEQIGVASGAVLQTRFGKPTRMAGAHPAMHVSWWEADAWCRWAGRRLPSEVEWEAAAHAAQRRGWRWGDVLEWTANLLRPWPGFSPDPDAAHAEPWFGRARVLRGASEFCPPRLHDLRLRQFAAPDSDELFVGFRSCAF